MLEGLAVDAAVTLPAHGASTGRARRFVTDVLAAKGLDHLLDAASMAVSELVTNAVLHGRTDVDVTISSDRDRVHVAVGDLSDDRPVLRSYDAYATTGRGLALVRALVQDLGVQPREVGKAVWFVLATVVPADVEEGPSALLELWDLDGPTPEQEPGAAPGSVVAVLAALPVDLWRSTQEHNDAALRELVLYRGERIGDSVEAWAWYAAADRAHTLLAAAVEHALAAGPAAQASGGQASGGQVSVEVPRAGDLAGDVAALAEALAASDTLAAAHQLLIDPAPADVLALRTWCFEQVRTQSEGGPATPWRG